MREAAKRAFAVLWLAVGCVCMYALFHFGPGDSDAWKVIGWSVSLTWAAQFIVTGIRDPFTLFATLQRLDQ